MPHATKKTFRTPICITLGEVLNLKTIPFIACLKRLHIQDSSKANNNEGIIFSIALIHPSLSPLPPAARPARLRGEEHPHQAEAGPIAPSAAHAGAASSASGGVAQRESGTDSPTASALQ